MKKQQYKLPISGPEREALREKGQFWTPDWVAEAMVAYVIAEGADSIFDPAVGAGAFFRAAKSLEKETGRVIKLAGAEIDLNTLKLAKDNGLCDTDLAHVKITDFFHNPPTGPYKAIVANPPYIRHHRLSNAVKNGLKAFSFNLLGKSLDGRAGFHVYFLLRALQLLDDDGRLAFIMPADTCEGVFSRQLWYWITKKYRLESVITFTPAASPFPKVDTNPIIFMIKNAKPTEKFKWVKCLESHETDLKEWALSNFHGKYGKSFLLYEREIADGLKTGLSRPPTVDWKGDMVLADFANVLRGIATGANEFFFLTRRQAAEYEIPDAFLLSAIGRTRDVPADEITSSALDLLDGKGRPTLLFSPDGRPLEKFPKSVREYLKHGIELGIDKRSLISTRNPWYKMEVRKPPPILFAYLGRRNTRFILNKAGVVPLTGFLCVYPKRKDETFLKKLWQILKDPETIKRISLVGKSYGDGAIKVEPRALEMLPISQETVLGVGLGLHPKAKQFQFCYNL